MKTRRSGLIWVGVLIAFFAPILLAATSPLLAWRDSIYIAAGFAGIVAMSLLLLQPLLAANLLPGIGALRARRLHRGVGLCLVLAVLIHVAGLYLTSPLDVVDALMFVSPTPFSHWGVIGMWALFATAILAAMRKGLGLRPNMWRALHMGLGLGIVVCVVLHALLIEGTMEVMSKIGLSVLLFGVSIKAMFALWLRR